MTLGGRGGTVVQTELGDALKQLSFPVCYLDFETIAPAAPLFPGTRAFQTIPFQWSLHVSEQELGAARHGEFLADADGDPRKAFLDSLIDALSVESGMIAVYSSFEKTQLNALARDFPERRAEIEAILERLVDLLVIVRSHVYLTGFRGQFSIKTVGPSLASRVARPSRR